MNNSFNLPCHGWNPARRSRNQIGHFCRPLGATRIRASRSHVQPRCGGRTLGNVDRITGSTGKERGMRGRGSLRLSPHPVHPVDPVHLSSWFRVFVLSGVRDLRLDCVPIKSCHTTAEGGKKDPRKARASSTVVVRIKQGIKEEIEPRFNRFP
jgi:hypothetical protein